MRICEEYAFPYLSFPIWKNSESGCDCFHPNSLKVFEKFSAVWRRKGNLQQESETNLDQMVEKYIQTVYVDHTYEYIS